MTSGKLVMKRRLLLAACLAAAGCSDSGVVVRAALVEGAPVADLPVWVLPYDRQALLDSLAADAGTPEPAVPAEVLQQLESLRASEASAATDSARRRARQQRVGLQAQVDSIRGAAAEWRRRVYADFDSLAHRRESELGVPARVDTTDAAGVARVPAEGRVWVWAQYLLPDTLLEWNRSVTVRGDSAVVRLTRENAKVRPFY